MRRNLKDKQIVEPILLKRDLNMWPYGLTSVLLLVILTLAILAPDYWNYRYQLSIAMSRNMATVPTIHINSNALPTILAIDSNAPLDVIKAIDLTTIDPPLKTSDIFETYGKLLTLLLGFISVLAVFLGYFVRRSLREVEEDMHSSLKNRMEQWEKQKDALINDFSKQMEEVSKELAAFKKLKEEGEQALNVLKEQAKAEKESAGVSVIAASAATQAIDQDETIMAHVPQGPQ